MTAVGAFDKVVVVTRKTRLGELVERWNTAAQARFVIERAGGDFQEYQREDDAYRRSLETIVRSCEVGLKVHVADRALVPTMLFSAQDLVVTAGQDGLVANTAKYVGDQPIVAVNPDPERFDGILLPFRPDETEAALRAVMTGRARIRKVTLAEAALADGQRLLAFNDIFVGAASHVSARYRIRLGGKQAGPAAAAGEPQSSSGVLVSTGAGASGWLSSVFNMAAGVARFYGGSPGRPPALTWEERRLAFVVREPFRSKHSRADLVTGLIGPEDALHLESLMPSGGVIFSDGMESDFLAFNAGATAAVRPAPQRAHLVAR